LARDIGLALGSGAHLIALERTRIGEVLLKDCWQIDDLVMHVEADILHNQQLTLEANG